jgi:hypothetical protein
VISTCGEDSAPTTSTEATVDGTSMRDTTARADPIDGNGAEAASNTGAATAARGSGVSAVSPLATARSGDENIGTTTSRPAATMRARCWVDPSPRMSGRCMPEWRTMCQASAITVSTNTASATQAITSAVRITMSAMVCSVSCSVSAVQMRDGSHSAGDGTPWNGSAPPKRSCAAHTSPAGTATTSAARTTSERTNWNVREPADRRVMAPAIDAQRTRSRDMGTTTHRVTIRPPPVPKPPP